MKRRLEKVEGNQKILIQAAGESVSILNVTRLDEAKNRGRLNESISEMHLLSGEVANISETLEREFQELSGFMQQYFLLTIVANRVRQTGQSQIISLEHVRTQLDMLSLGNLSPNLVTTWYLRELLQRIQANLPHHLRLPVDPVKELGKYYSLLGSTTILEEVKLLVLVSVPLVERGSRFEVYELMNLPIAFPRVEQKQGIVAWIHGCESRDG